MPKVTKTLGNNKVRACESPDFAHNKEDVSVLTHPPFIFYSSAIFSFGYAAFSSCIWQQVLYSNYIGL